MQPHHLLLLLPAVATCQPSLQRRGRAEYEASRNPRPSNAYESKTNPNAPAHIDHRQRAREDFLESTAREYGTKPSKLVHGRRPMTKDCKKQLATVPRAEMERPEEEEEEEEWVGGSGEVAGRPRPLLELGFGYNKGAKYDNGYGHLRAFEKGIVDVGAVEALAAGMAEKPEIEYYEYEGEQR